MSRLLNVWRQKSNAALVECPLILLNFTRYQTFSFVKNVFHTINELFLVVIILWHLFLKAIQYFNENLRAEIQSQISLNIQRDIEQK